jgi:hypothetical protein
MSVTKISVAFSTSELHFNNNKWSGKIKQDKELSLNKYLVRSFMVINIF